MTGPKPMACVVGECASGFAYREECALVASGCCAREMLATANRSPNGVHYHEITYTAVARDLDPAA